MEANMHWGTLFFLGFSAILWGIVFYAYKLYGAVPTKVSRVLVWSNMALFCASALVTIASSSPFWAAWLAPSPFWADWWPWITEAEIRQLREFEWTSLPIATIWVSALSMGLTLVSCSLSRFRRREFA